MSKETILQKAKKINHQPKKTATITKEIQDAALAWCRGEITITQIARAMDLNNTGYRVYALLAHSLKNYLNKNYKK